MSPVSRIPPSYIPSLSNAHTTPPPSYRAWTQHKPSLDFHQRFERKLAEYNASQNIFKRWLFEIISVGTSAICMGKTPTFRAWCVRLLTMEPGAIIGLLYYLHDQPFDKWPPGLTIITVLSKIASAALILPISEAIGQLKWTWFHGKNSKDPFDFEIFDKASRGAWGSFMLLCRTKGKSLAALGALITVLLLAIDTFFQQVTDLSERWKLQGESYIPRVVRYEPLIEFMYDTSFMNNDPSSIVNNDLKTALTPFFYDKNGTSPLKIGNATQAQIPLGCPTSNCEWPPYETLAVCSACEDISHLLEYACLNMGMDWIKNSTGSKRKEPFPIGKDASRSSSTFVSNE